MDVQQQESNPINHREMTEKEVTKAKKNRLKNALERVKSTFVGWNFLKKAEIALAKYVQRQRFSKVLLALESKDGTKQKLKRFPGIQKLDPILVDGMLQVGGRLDAANISFDESISSI